MMAMDLLGNSSNVGAMPIQSGNSCLAVAGAPTTAGDRLLLQIMVIEAFYTDYSAC